MTTHETKHDSEARMKRGLAIFESSKSITENADGSFAVPSQTGSNSYEVRLIGKRWVCTCPDFEYRTVDACKHIYAVRVMIAAKTYLKDEPTPKVFADDAIPCDRCGSIRVIRYGTYASKRVFYCKDCRHKFREPSIIKSKFTPELVTLTLDLYFSGLSLRKVARNISDHFGVSVGSTTIYNWIQKYVPMIAEYVNSLAPQLSKEWHADELFVKVRGGSKHAQAESMGFLWNIMDRETRFLIASKLSKGRDLNGAIVAFREAVQNAHDNDPEVVYTDALGAYRQAVPEFFPLNPPKHVRNCGVGKLPHETNNRVERLNGTLRERTKVQRGWKKLDTPLADGQRIQYNFVKPHMALNGKTPAQMAGMTPKGWKELLEKAVNNQRGTTKENNR